MDLQTPFTAALLACGAGCAAPAWQAGPSLLARPRLVAEALDDPFPASDFDPAAAAVPARPTHLRPCCAFGADLRPAVGGVPVPFYRVGNMLDAGTLGGHAYDNRALPVSPAQEGVEHNGLAYTCRGGWIDVAHVRDHADLTLYLALLFARELGRTSTFEMPGDGAERRVVIAPISREVLERHGRLEVAIVLAEWTAFQFSVWHEIASWWGWESTPPFSERLSTFTPEDLYSNLLGIRIGAGVVRDEGFRSRDEYDRQAAAWIAEALRRLGVVPASSAHAIMQALDGRWWDSTRRVPDVHLVMRRAFGTGPELTPWRAEDAWSGTVPDELRTRCPATARALPLRLPTGVEGLVVADTVDIAWRPGRWADASFPFPDTQEHVVRSSQLPALVAATRADMQRVLGEGFDRPYGPIASPVAP